MKIRMQQGRNVKIEQEDNTTSIINIIIFNSMADIKYINKAAHETSHRDDTSPSVSMSILQHGTLRAIITTTQLNSSYN